MGREEEGMVAVLDLNRREDVDCLIRFQIGGYIHLLSLHFLIIKAHTLPKKQPISSSSVIYL